MVLMLQRQSIRACAVLAGFGLALSSLALYSQDDNSHRGRKYKTPPPSARIEVTVLKAANGKPIENAAVVFHPIEGDKDVGALEVKTNEDGKAMIDVIPIGDTVRMQIIANGFQTYGEDYKVDKDQIVKEIRMNRPGQQYSIYDHNEDGSKKNKDAPKDQSPDSKPDAPK